MECFAGFLSHADEQLGRVLDFLDEIGDADNTIVIVVSDNGASSEGGPTGSINDVRLVNLDPATNDEMFDRLDEIGGPLTHNNYPWGWTMAGNTPFRRWKREVHEGGIADPCIVSWPRGVRDGLIEAGGIRHQFAHAIDVLPTLAELVGSELTRAARSTASRRRSIDGVSFGYLLAGDGADRPERHETQYFEMLGSRAIYHRGLEGGHVPPGRPALRRPGPERVLRRRRVGAVPRRRGPVGDATTWRPSGPSCWPSWSSCGGRRRGGTRCCRSTTGSLWALVNPKPDHRRPREVYRYFPGGAPVPESVAVKIRNRSHALVVDVTVAEAGQCRRRAAGAGFGARRLVAARARRPDPLRAQPVRQGTAHRRLLPGRLDAGEHRIEYIFDEGCGPRRHRRAAVRRAGGRPRAEIPRFTPSGFNAVGVGLTCGYEWGPAVGDGYEAPFPFAGVIRRAVVEVTGPGRPRPAGRTGGDPGPAVTGVGCWQALTCGGTGDGNPGRKQAAESVG